MIDDEADRLKPKTFAEVRDIFLISWKFLSDLVGTDRLDAVIKRMNKFITVFGLVIALASYQG